MKRIFTTIVLLFLNLSNAQVNLNFNNDTFPENWTQQGTFEISDAAIHPICQEKALLGSFFEQNTEFWIGTDTYDYNGGNVEIKVTFGLKDLYHSLGINSSFQKPNLYIQYAEGDSDEWTEYAEIPTEGLETSTNCLQRTIIMDASVLQGFETIKYRFIYASPPQTGSIYLLYWAIDKLSINEEVPSPFPCTENLGGGLEPSFVSLKINGTSFDHNTYSEPTSYYHHYPKSGNTSATLEIGQTYDLFTFTSSEAVVGAWMDYNQNNIFEDDEYTELVNNLNAQNTTAFTIPTTSNEGDVAMRIRSRAYGSTINAGNACTSFGSGETRDYIFTVSNILGVNDQSAISNLRIYPNPTSNQITIEASFEIQKIEIFNMIGQLITDSTTKTIDVSNLDTGTYVVNVFSKDGAKSSRKIIKQ